MKRTDAGFQIWKLIFNFEIRFHGAEFQFRFRWGFSQIRLLAFWDKTDNEETLVVAMHGFIKKTDKVPGNEIVRARNIRGRTW